MNSYNPYDLPIQSNNNNVILKQSLLSESVISNFQEKYSSLNPSEFVQCIKGVHNSPKYSFERVSFLAKALEGFNYSNRIKISTIRDSIDKNVYIPCIQNGQNNDLNTIHILNWMEGDLQSEYNNGKVFKNHTNSFDGDFHYSDELRCSIYCGARGGYLSIYLFIGILIILLSLFVDPILCLFVSVVTLAILCMVIGNSLCDKGYGNISDTYSKHDEIQDKIEFYYKNLINNINFYIPQYFPIERPNNIKKFSLFLIEYVFQPAENELNYFFTTDKHISTISKDVFEDYLMIFRFLRYRYNKEPDQIFENKMINKIISAIFEGNDELSNYLLNLFDLKEIFGYFNLKKLNIINIIGIENKNLLINLIQQIKNFENQERFSLIKSKLNI